MRVLVRRLAAWWVLWLVGGMAAVRAADCPALEEKVAHHLAGFPMVAEQTSPLLAMGQDAFAALRQCPDSPRLWYLAARAAEMLEAPEGPDHEPAFPEHGSARQIAREAAAHAPRSAPIATVVARQEGTLEAAQQAHGLAPAYRPASRVLAVALARAGRPDEALALLKFPETYPAAMTRIARADVLLAAGRGREAEREARQALAHPYDDPDEPSSRDALAWQGKEALGLALLAQKRPREAVPFLRAAAAGGSQAAGEALKTISER